MLNSSWKNGIISVIICFITLYTFADLGDADWDTVNDALKQARNAAAADSARNTQCSAAGICLETSKWLYELGQQQAHRENLINKADHILNLPNFQNKPWAVYFGDIGLTILATENMAYLFRHDGNNDVFLDSIYYYNENLGGSVSDHTERQRLFIQPSNGTNRSLWSIDCRTFEGGSSAVLESSNAANMSTPTIGGIDGSNAWVKFQWNNLTIPSTDRHVSVEVKVEVYTGSQAIAGLSEADSTHGSWWIDVNHISGDDVNLWSVEFPRIDKLAKFHRFPSDNSYIVIPKCGGAAFEVGQFEEEDLEQLHYPGSDVPYQLAINYQNNAGLVFYCDDIEGYHKMLKTGDNSDGTRVAWVHYPKMQGGTNAEVELSDPGGHNYACRIGVFTGDWYEAAVWFRENWMDNSYADFLPDSIRGGWLLDAHHGTYTWATLRSEYDSWLDNKLDTHFPGDDWLGSHSGYAWKPAFEPESIKYNGQWIYEPMVEVVTQSGRDYVYDPIQGSHYNRINSLRKDHNINVLLYTAGRLMCKRFENEGENPDSPHYVQDGELWAVRTEGGTHQPHIPRRDKDGNLIGDRGYVCPANRQWREFIGSQIEQMTIRAGSVSKAPKGVYLDVTCNRPTYGGPCYNITPGHGHPDERGGGTHYAQGTIDLVNTVRDYGNKNGNTEFVVATEGHGDIFIKHLDSYIYFQNVNDDYISLPVSQVLWADFIRPYADKHAGVRWDGKGETPMKTARAFVYGCGLGRIKENTFNDNGNQLRIIKRMVWYRRNFSQFLARGRMFRPPTTNRSHNEIVCASWKNGDDVLFAFANGTESDKSVNAEFNLNNCEIDNPLAYKLYEVDEDGTYESDISASDFSSNGIANETFTLQALGENTTNKGVLCFVAKKLCPPSDTDLVDNGIVDINDFSFLANWWLRIDCGYMNECCDGSDLDNDQKVNLNDIAELSKDWLY